MDMIADFLTIIRNGITNAKHTVNAPYSALKEHVAVILKQEGFIKDFEVVQEEGPKKRLKIDLKYVEGESAIHELVRQSKPGKRQYAGVRDLKPVKGKLGVAIVSTSKGLMTDKRAKEMVLGGEVICTVW